MKGKGNFRRATVVGAGVLAAGSFAMAAPAGPALASPAAGSTTAYDLEAGANVKALGHTWTLNIGATNNSAGALLATGNKGASEFHGWDSTASFAPLAARDLTVTSTGHATFKTGSDLSPVLAVSLAFTPVKAQKVSCATGSATAYIGYVTGTATLVTGLRGVRISAAIGKSSGAAVLNVGNSCVMPSPCADGGWNLPSASLPEGMMGDETLGAKPSWGATLVKDQVKTASKYLVRTDQVIVGSGEPAPQVNTTAHTVAVTTSGAITGSAVIRYSSASLPAVTCYMGSQEYTETGVQYSGSVKTTRPFQASTILTGTLSLSPSTHGTYASVTLRAR